jgi:hypothetical protein
MVDVECILIVLQIKDEFLKLQRVFSDEIVDLLNFKGATNMAKEHTEKDIFLEHK